MKKVYALIFLCFCVVSSLQAQTTIYAYRNWQQSNPVNVQKGPVKFSSDNLGVVELIADLLWGLFMQVLILIINGMRR